MITTSGVSTLGFVSQAAKYAKLIAGHGAPVYRSLQLYNGMLTQAETNMAERGEDYNSHHVSRPQARTNGTQFSKMPNGAMTPDKDGADLSASSSHTLLDDVISPVAAPEVTQEEEQDDVTKEGGWGWVVVFGTFLNYVLVSGYIKSSGLFFVELLQQFNAPATQATLLFAVRAATYSVVGFYVMTVCLPRFGARKLILIGGSSMSLSAILSSRANELASLICLQSILLAVGRAMLIAPGQVLLGAYFTSRRSLALCLSELGVSVGNMVIPPLVSLLLRHYGLHGALLVYGAVCLHSLPAALLHRPITRHRRIRHREGGGRDVGTGRTGGEELVPLKPDVTDIQDDDTGISVTTVGHSASHTHHGHHSVNIAGHSEGEHGPNDSSAVSPALRSSTGLSQGDKDCSAEGTCNEAITRQKAGFCRPGSVCREAVTNQEDEDVCSEADSRQKASVCRPGSVCREAITGQEVDDHSASGKVDTRQKGGVRSVCREAVTNREDEDVCSETDSRQKAGVRSACRDVVRRVIGCPKMCLTLIDLSLFSSPLFCLFLLFNLLSDLVAVPVDYLPALVTHHDVTEDQAALLLSVIGGLDLVCRVTCCVIAYTERVSAVTVTLVSYVILGVVMQFVRFMTSFEHFLALAVIQGLLGSVGYCLFPVLVIEFVGLHRMAKTIGFGQLTGGASLAALYALLGYIRDITGSYTAVYHVIGAGQILSAIFLCFERPVRRLETRKKHANSQSATL